MNKFVTNILDINTEKKALNILSTLRKLATKHSNKDLESATETLLEISHHPTVAVLKGILDRQKKRKQKQSLNHLHSNDKTDDYGFVRGAQYFGRDK